MSTSINQPHQRCIISNHKTLLVEDVQLPTGRVASLIIQKFEDEENLFPYVAVADVPVKLFNLPNGKIRVRSSHVCGVGKTVKECLHALNRNLSIAESVLACNDYDEDSNDLTRLGICSDINFVRRLVCVNEFFYRGGLGKGKELLARIEEEQNAQGV